MQITAVVDRIENGNAILLSDEFDVEISIPVDKTGNLYNKGETVTLILDRQGNVKKI